MGIRLLKKNESTNDLRGFYLKVWYGLISDHKMSADAADALCDKYEDEIVSGYEDGKGPAEICDALALKNKKREDAPSGNARSVSSFALSSKTSERGIEKFVSTLEDAVLDNHTVETTAEPNGVVDVDIYGKLSPDVVSRILQVANQLGINIADLSINI